MEGGPVVTGSIFMTEKGFNARINQAEYQTIERIVLTHYEPL